MIDLKAKILALRIRPDEFYDGLCRASYNAAVDSAAELVAAELSDNGGSAGTASAEVCDWCVRQGRCSNGQHISWNSSGAVKSVCSCLCHSLKPANKTPDSYTGQERRVQISDAMVERAYEAWCSHGPSSDETAAIRAALNAALSECAECGRKKARDLAGILGCEEQAANMIVDQAERIAQLEAELSIAHINITRYGRHVNDYTGMCDLLKHSERPCSCGFDSIDKENT